MAYNSSYLRRTLVYIKPDARLVLIHSDTIKWLGIYQVDEYIMANCLFSEPWPQLGSIWTAFDHYNRSGRVDRSRREPRSDGNTHGNTRTG